MPVLMSPAPDHSAANGAPLAWVPWLQAGVTAMLLVLFVVMVGKTRQQSAAIRQLQDQVQGLENARALERTAGLEQQLRTTVERLQAVERTSARIDALSSSNANLTQELRRLKGNQASEAAPPALSDELPLAPLPPLKPAAPAN
jgi:TolA-binding protein